MRAGHPSQQNISGSSAYGVRRMEAPRSSPALRVRVMLGIKFYSHRCQHWLTRPDAVVWPRGNFRLFTAPCLLHAGRRWSALKSSNKDILPVRRNIQPESHSRLDGVWPKQWAPVARLQSETAAQVRPHRTVS